MSRLRIALEPVLTPLFRTWWRVQRGMTMGVRGVATDEDGRVALVRHTYMDGWFLPGGGVEHDETVQMAVCREMAEEAGVLVEGAPRLFGVYSQHPKYKNDHVVLFIVERWRACAPDAAQEIAEARFFHPTALPDGVTPATRARLAEVFQGASVSAYW